MLQSQILCFSLDKNQTEDKKPQKKQEMKMAAVQAWQKSLWVVDFNQ